SDIMNSKDAKKISLVGYLYSLGHSPLSRRGEHFLYLSPLREKRHPSFQVNQTKNIWFDYGMGRGGTIIDFTLLYYNLSEVSDALKKIAEKAEEITPVSFSFHPPGYVSGFEIVKIKSLENKTLINYLKERGINIEIAKKQVHEIYFKQSGKNYFALAFQNQSGGYKVRNRYFKGCIPPKDITIVCNESDKCNVFEGFMDYRLYGK
ncbi:MAG: CHC2 zinc finger domain-containing protein, partial [Tannerellaceae bacterium]|nr:CHC2 zinc finger domain-containing protein [Tannerellaceae bacterium]